MPCTTLLVGKNVSYDGSTLMARNEDSPSGQFTPKKFITVLPEEQPKEYHAVLSKVVIPLPDNPLRYTAMPNAQNNEGIWGEAGINACNVAMSETETITSNPRVLGADPLVKDGIGEEDLLTLVLPYIRTAREGVLRLGKLLETYGTYEMNGIGFQDVNEIWWLESIGSHHWIAKRVPDDEVVVMPNQQGIDYFDLCDAFGEQKEHLCSQDLLSFITENHLDLTLNEERDVPLAKDTVFDCRLAFGSHDDADHTYNTPRAWFMLRYLAPFSYKWEGPDAIFRPEDDDLPWSLVPDRKVTVEDVKYLLSSHYQGTPYDPYGRGSEAQKGKYRPIGINRTNFVALTQLRPYMPPEKMAVEWIAEGCNVYNAFVPFYANVDRTPEYLSQTGELPDTHEFYWANRLIGALADSHHAATASAIERYQNAVAAKGRALLQEGDKADLPADGVSEALAQWNDKIASMAQEETQKALGKVLYEASNGMKNSFARSDA